MCKPGNCCAIVCGALLALCGAGRAGAVETPQLRMIGASAGLPSTDILGLAQDRDGYVWIATMDGLARYDGVEMDVWRHDPEDTASLPENRLQTLCIDADDRVWVGTVTAGAAVLDSARQGFVRYDRARFPLMRSNLVLAIASEPGAVWLGTADGLYRIATDAVAGTAQVRAFLHDPDDAASLPGRTVINMNFDARGQLWLATTGGLARIENGQLQRVPLPGEAFPVVYSATVQGDAIVIGSANGVFVGTGDGAWEQPTWSSQFARPNAVIASVADPGGGLWLGSQRGAWRIPDEGAPAPLLPTVDAVSVPVQSLLMQRDGALWVPVFGQGLGYLRPDWRRVMQFARSADELSADRYRSMALAASGGVWMLARNGAVERLNRSGVVERLPPRIASQIRAVRPLALAVDDGGAFWVGAPDSVLRIQPGGRVERWEHDVAQDAALPGLNRMLVSLPGQQVWISNAMTGLQLRDARSGRVLRNVLAADHPEFDLGDLEYMDIGADGALWLAGADGLARMGADGIEGDAALRGQRVLAFGFDGEEAVWLFRNNQLQRFERRHGRWEPSSTVGAAHGLPTLTVGGLRVDARHRVWLSSPRGLYRWDPASAHLQHIGVQNGLRSQEFVEGALALDADGLLVGATIDGGVVAIDTRLPDPPVYAPALHVKSVAVWRGGQWHARDASAGLVLAHDESEFRISLRLLDYADPASHRYWSRLEGHDGDWVEQGQQGERVFSGVPPGHYQLHLRALDAAGHAANGPVVNVTMRAPWWNTDGFRALLLVLAVAAIFTLAALYRRHLHRRHAWQLARAERELAQHASLAKTRFLATLGHEVRTPMTGVLGMSELLLDSALTSEQRNYAQSIQHAGQHLLRLVNDALDLARIESGRLELERQPFDLQQMLDDVVALEAPLAQARGLHFKYVSAPGVPRWLLGDCGRVRQIVLNLIGNAIKFTEHGSVTLRVEPGLPKPPGGIVAAQGQPGATAQSAAAGIRIIISDTGPGLNPDQVERLFRRFEQAEGARTAARYGGSGLGLAISQELAAAMAGRIGVESTPGRGTAFIVELPLPAAAVPVAVPASAPHGTRLAALRLLLVEDDATVAAVVVGLLHAQGHRVVHVSHGLAALAETARQSFDLALLDLDLPGVDGLRLAELLREQGFKQPLIALTARSDAEAEPASDAAGFAQFLRKPVTGAMLAAVMERALLPTTSTTPLPR